MPGWVLDYVLVHELAHLLVPGHGADFWELVGRYPRSERARGYLEGVAAAAHLDRSDAADAGRGRLRGPTGDPARRRAAAGRSAGRRAPARRGSRRPSSPARWPRTSPTCSPTCPGSSRWWPPRRTGWPTPRTWSGPARRCWRRRGPAGRRAAPRWPRRATTRPPCSPPTSRTCPACWWPSRSRRCPPRRSRPRRPTAAGWSRWPPAAGAGLAAGRRRPRRAVRGGAAQGGRAEPGRRRAHAGLAPAAPPRGPRRARPRPRGLGGDPGAASAG